MGRVVGPSEAGGGAEGGYGDGEGGEVHLASSQKKGIKAEDTGPGHPWTDGVLERDTQASRKRIMS